MATARITTTVSTKGQVILPKIIREQLRWQPGTQLVVESTSQGVLLKQATPSFAPVRAEDVFGSLSHSGTPKTLEEMDAGIAAEVKRRHARD